MSLGSLQSQLAEKGEQLACTHHLQAQGARRVAQKLERQYAELASGLAEAKFSLEAPKVCS